MLKKVLAKLGYLTEEQIKEIDDLHMTEIADSYVPLNRLEEEREAHKKTRATLDEQSKTIEALNAKGQSAEELSRKLDELTAKAEADKKAWEETQKKAEESFNLERKKLALSMAIASDEKVSPIDLDYVSGLYDLDTIKLDEKGTKIISGFVEQHDNLLKDRPNLFTAKTAKQGVKKIAGSNPGDSDPNGGNGDDAVAYGKSLAQTVLKRRNLLTETSKED